VKMEKGWTLVYTLNLRYRAEMAKQILEEEGITAVIINKRDSSYQAFGAFEIYTQDTDAEKATAILKEVSF